MANIEDYEYMNEDSIHEDLFCPLCTNPLEEPLCADQCGHTFCRKCITNIFRGMSKCPTCRQTLTLEDFHPVTLRPFLNQLNQILVECKCCSQTNIQRGNLKDHRKTCTKIMVSCPAANIKCNWMEHRDKIQDHVNTCPLIKIQPVINELNELIKQQSKQINFLYTILEKTSENHKKTCEENYKTQVAAICDICNELFTLDENKPRLHYCPQTDICLNCMKEHFS